MRAVRAALPGDLLPQPAREPVVPPAQLGEEGAHHRQADEVRGIVIGPDGARFLQVTGYVGAMLLEEVGQLGQERRLDCLPHQAERQRDGHGPQADLHRAGPLHAQPFGIGGSEFLDGVLPGPGPGVVAAEVVRLGEAPQAGGWKRSTPSPGCDES